MSFLLDTCVLSELVKPRPASSVREWVAHQEEHALFLSVITIGELHKGVAKLPSSRRRDTIARWIEEDLKIRFRDRILDVDSYIAKEWGELLGNAERRGRPIPAIDALIAATAKIHACAVVTRNEADMNSTGVVVINPWAGSDDQDDTSSIE